ncbi:MAG: UMP kinase [Vampirovibrionales bacterium]|nr:UMP kinase [Vampirovibrionales bacterium]
MSPMPQTQHDPSSQSATESKMPELKYKRILLKISGEALMGDEKFGIKPDVINGVADEIASIRAMGIDVAIVVGGGNIFRGLQQSSKIGMDRAAADYVGMLATTMNALILQGVLKNKNVSVRVMSAIGMDRIAEPYIRLRATRHIEKGRVVIFAGGTGNPYFSTDTTSALRAAEIDADVIMMAKNGVDGVYDKDPKEHADAVKFDNLTYDDVLLKNLRVMDQTAISLCKETKLPIIVFDFNQEGAIRGITHGEKIGTLIQE